MSISYNASIVTDGLVLALDAANPKSYDARENLLTYSEQVNNAAWGLGNLTVVADATVAPNGTLTADKIVESTAASAYHYSPQVITKPAIAGTYTYSIYAKDAGRAVIGLRIESSSNGAVYEVNVATGAARVTAGTYGTSFSNAVGSFTAVGNGWYRISLTVTTDAATSIFVQNYLYSIAAGSIVYTGDGTSGIYVWGAQFERASTPSAYVQTTATAITRSSTWYDMSGYGNHGSFTTVNTLERPAYNANNQGSIYFNNAEQTYVSCSNGASLNTGNLITISAFFKPTAIGVYQPIVAKVKNDYSLGWEVAVHTTGQLRTTLRPGGLDLQSTATVAANTWVMATVTFDGTVARLYFNGNFDNQTSNTTTTMTLNSDVSLLVGGRGPTPFVTGYIPQVLLYNRALSDAEVRRNFNALRGRYGI